MAYLSRELGTILRHSDGLGEVKELERKEIKRDELLEIFKDLEFNSLIKMNLDSGIPGLSHANRPGDLL